MQARRARHSLPPLLVGWLVLSLVAALAACTSDPEEPPPPEATSSAATPTPAPTPTTAPAPTPTATQSHARAPTATPPLPPEDLGIHEVDTAAALEAAGLTHVRYAAGQEVPWDPGLFLLDVESGEVEGWVRSLAALPEEERSEAWRISDDLAVSPSNRFVSWASFGILHDRHSGRTYALDEGTIEFDRWWGTGTRERLFFRLANSSAFVLTDAELRPVVRLELPSGERFTSPDGGYILVRECIECEPGDRFHLVNLKDEANPTIHSWTLPWTTVRYGRWGSLPYRIELLDEIVAFVADAGSGSCRVARYSLVGSLLSDRTIPCWAPRPVQGNGVGLPRISPDGRLVAGATSGIWTDHEGIPVIATISVFDAATGDEVVRIQSASAPWSSDIGLTDLWLADSSGIVVGTRHGPRTVTLCGRWERAPGRPAPDNPDRFLRYESWAFQPVVLDQHGQREASLSYGPVSGSIPDPPSGAALIRRERRDWDATSDTLRVWTTFFHAHHPPADDDDYWYPDPPLAPVIELPPLGDEQLVEVVADTCLNLREDHSLEASIATCLPNGAVAETDDFVTYPQPWMHLRTGDGLEGWAIAEYLRWHSDGVRLVEGTPGTFTTIAVGGHYDACALTEAGEAVCWNMEDPSALETLPGRYIAIDASEGTTCTITRDGEAACWGSDESASDAPTGRYTAISTTPGYTCALTEAREVVCWGYNSERAHNERARANADDPSWVPDRWLPDPPPGPYVGIMVSRVASVGDDPWPWQSACARKASGGFVCWELSTRYDPHARGHVWHVDEGSENTPIAGDFCQVSGGYGSPKCGWSGAYYAAVSDDGRHVCAITADGKAECWASKAPAIVWGALSVMRPPDPSPARYVAISTGGDIGCAVTDAGDIACWEAERNFIARPERPPGRYVAVSDGTNHTCGLTEAGEAVCWGWNNHGQADVPPGRYAAISAGEYHTCALTEAGEAVCWGLISSKPPAGRYAAIGAGGDAYSPSACALTDAGTVVCWGDNDYGEPLPPREWSSAKTLGGRYATLAVGETHSCALNKAGEATCRDRQGFRVGEPPGERLTAVGVGYRASCGLTEAGEVVCWSRSYSIDPPAGRFSALAVGWQHACALSAAGDAVCWAWEAGRGDDPYEPSPFEYELTRPPSGPFVAISAGEYRSCAVSEQGDIVCWGDVAYASELRPILRQ